MWGRNGFVEIWGYDWRRDGTCGSEEIIDYVLLVHRPHEHHLPEMTIIYEWIRVVV